MYDIQYSGQLALKLICETIALHYYPCKLDISAVKDLITKHEIDPEHIIAVTLMYRASVDASTDVDSYDVMCWLTSQVKRYCKAKSDEEEARAASEEEES